MGYAEKIIYYELEDIVGFDNIATRNWTSMVLGQTRVLELIADELENSL